MKLEDQVITLEQAIILKELDIEQQSYFYHRIYGHNQRHLRYPGRVRAGDKNLIHRDIGDSDTVGSIYALHECYAAFTVAELGVMLSDDAKFAQTAYWIDKRKDFSSVTNYPTEAQARAAFLIHLLKSGEITPEGVNRRLRA